MRLLFDGPGCTGVNRVVVGEHFERVEDDKDRHYPYPCTPPGEAPVSPGIAASLATAYQVSGQRKGKRPRLKLILSQTNQLPVDGGQV